MICPKCKAMLANNATFCNRCGMVFYPQNNQQNNQRYTNGFDSQHMNNESNSIYRQNINSQQNQMGNSPQFGPNSNIQQPNPYVQQNQQYGNFGQNYNQQTQQPPNSGTSGLGVAALILSILGCTAIIGAVLATMDISKNDGKSKTVSKVAIGICVFWLLIGFIGYVGKNDKKNDVTVESTTETKKNDDNSTKYDEKDDNLSTNEKIGIGDEFENKTIKGIVTYADLDYKDYNKSLTEVESDQRAVFIKIKVTNISDESNYVSVGDFDCYVDNVSTDSELISGSDFEYNANIEAGRSAILGALYVVPADAKNIELEYKPIGEKSDRIIIVISDETTTETIIETDEEVGDDKSSVSDDVKVINIGDEFGNNTITGVVEEADLEYTGYNKSWTEISDGSKAIYMRIKMTNISDETNYVSVGDFDCYVDDVITNAEVITGSDEDYNANIESGRSAVLGAMYIIPEDASSIELEYKPIGESSDRVIIKIQ